MKHTKQNRLNILASPPARRVSGASVSGPSTSVGSTSHGRPSATSTPRAPAALPGRVTPRRRTREGRDSTKSAPPFNILFDIIILPRFPFPKVLL